MGTGVVCATYPRVITILLAASVEHWLFILGDASVGGHYEDGSHVTLQSSIEERKTLNVQHVDFVNEENLIDMEYVYSRF